VIPLSCWTRTSSFTSHGVTPWDGASMRSTTFGAGRSVHWCPSSLPASWTPSSESGTGARRSVSTQGRIVTAYGEIDHFTENVQKPARPMGKNDLWIAATAHVTGAALLTSDGDFDHLAPRFFRLVRVDARSGETLIER
jgi:hypothetical protein